MYMKQSFHLTTGQDQVCNPIIWPLHSTQTKIVKHFAEIKQILTGLSKNIDFIAKLAGISNKGFSRDKWP